jgi:2-C-methyl-D-erythritol 4-phosphate cytidylyltransferase
MTKTTIIVAGGSGLRMGHELPKQFLPIGGIPVLMLTIDAFYRYDAGMHLVVVLPSSQIDFWRELCTTHNFAIKHTVVAGGETRFHSVKNGLTAALPESLVAVHDGVRPFVSQQTIARCFDEALKSGSAIPVTASVESIRQIIGDASVSVNRASYMMVQTPQVFQWQVIDAAYQLPYDTLFTDDASVVEKACFKVTLVDGNRENLKLTTPFDLLVGEALFQQSNARP